jgi:hypothetical protein
MRKTIFLLIIYLLLSCENKTTEKRCYPDELPLPKEEYKVIDLNITKLNFRQITNLVENDGFEYDYNNVIIEFDDGKIRKKIMPYFYGSGLYKKKNVLKINLDSIFIDDNYPIGKIKRILKRHYLNKGKIPNYSDSPQKAIVEVRIDTNSSARELKELLIKLTRSFDGIKDEINDNIELRVYFDYLKQIPSLTPKEEDYQ